MENCTTNSGKISTIYGLCDENGKIRYVGVTCKTLEVRLSCHIYRARLGDDSHRSRWIRAMSSPPTIVAIEQTTDRLREIFWISYYNDAGNDLTNETKGGEGSIGWVSTPEHSENLSKSLKGKKRKPLSEEHKAKISLALNGTKRRPLSEEHKAKLSVGNIGKKHEFSLDHRKKLSEAAKARYSKP